MTIDLEPVPPEGDEEVLTLWDKRMVAAVKTAASARKGVKLLRVASGLVVALMAVGNWLVLYTTTSPSSDGVFEVATRRTGTDRIKLGQWLGSMSSAVAYAGVLLALSFLLAVYAARLDMDIILADEEEVARMDRADD